MFLRGVRDRPGAGAKRRAGDAPGRRDGELRAADHADGGYERAHGQYSVGGVPTRQCLC
ncbi:hypothetical protein SALBM135S_06851 [Streptomyces alboniger]